MRGHFLVAATATTPLKAKAILIKALYARTAIFVVLHFILDFGEKLRLLFFILKQFLKQFKKVGLGIFRKGEIGKTKNS